MDYIDVVDRSKAHVKGIQELFSDSDCFKGIRKLGDYSVLDVINASTIKCGQNALHTIVEGRAEDAASCYTHASFSKKFLGWRAKYDLNHMCKDHWVWQKHNPNRYD